MRKPVRARDIGPTPALPAVLFGVGLVLGGAVSALLLRGDAQGGVNLFYLLLYLVVMPVLGLLLTLLFLRANARGLAGLVLRLPGLPDNWSRMLLGLDEGQRRLWFFLASQAGVLGLACGNLLVYLLILLFRDVNFGWQSTLMDTQTATRLFAVFATPWQFWESAQATEELVLCTRVTLQQPAEVLLDSFNCHRQWWRYLLAAQLCYSLLPRTLLCLWAGWRLARDSEPEATTPLVAAPVAAGAAAPLAPLQQRLDGPYVRVRWDAVPDMVLKQVDQLVGQPVQDLAAGPLASAAQEQAALASSRVPVIFVKAWEPPMARLGDFLDQCATPGLLLPLDWEHGSDTLCPLRTVHREEWQRFCATHPNWRLLLPEGL